MRVLPKPKWVKDKSLLKSKNLDINTFHSLKSTNVVSKEVVKDADWLIFSSFFL